MFDRLRGQRHLPGRQQAVALPFSRGCAGCRGRSGASFRWSSSKKSMRQRLAAAHRVQRSTNDPLQGVLAVLAYCIDAAVAGIESGCWLQGCRRAVAGRRRSSRLFCRHRQSGGGRRCISAVIGITSTPLAALGQLIEAEQALGSDVLMRRKAVVGQGFAVREVQHC